MADNEKRDSMTSDGAGTLIDPSKTQSLWHFLNSDVDPKECTGPLIAYSFMTGFIDAVSFSSIFVWCGFQTGNFVQLSLALARLFGVGPGGAVDHTFHIADQQALTSLLSFQLGAFIGRIGDRIGAQKRIWLIFGTFLQTLFTMAAALTIWKSGQPGVASDRGDPSWTNALSFVCLAFMSLSLGTQGILAKRLNTQFGTTIVLTTIWVEVFTDPKLFSPSKVSTRDHKLLAAGFLFIGGFMSRAVLDKIGPAGALGVATGIRFLICFTWLFVPGKKSTKGQIAKQ
ncbi:hypothetical protein D9757_006513 [Collybiopsis confluens]|uniref:DUF1275 domain protein n=1 Tax=Collybiopsis confluens TaxID=2823264 RepID=A0A8H5HQ73_9AGAR|nr:hypothetical protein D9757_006513 [Collybiopsis confluens]